MAAESPLGRLTRALASHREEPLVARLCRALVAAGGADGGAITLLDPQQRRATLHATDAVAELVEDAQSVAQEGPSVDAARTRTVVGYVDRAEARLRWPLLAAAVESELATTALKAVPMAPGDRVVGVVLLHQEVRRASEVSDGDAQLMADASAILLAAHLDETSEDERWSLRDRISQATGMVMAQLGVTPEDAVAVLRAHAFARGLTLSEISGIVVSKDLRFDDDRGGHDR